MAERTSEGIHERPEVAIASILALARVRLFGVTGHDDADGDTQKEPSKHSFILKDEKTPSKFSKALEVEHLSEPVICASVCRSALDSLA